MEYLLNKSVSIIKNKKTTIISFDHKYNVILINLDIIKLILLIKVYYYHYYYHDIGI